MHWPGLCSSLLYHKAIPGNMIIIIIITTLDTGQYPVAMIITLAVGMIYIICGIQN